MNWFKNSASATTITEAELNKMTKQQIDNWAADHGINLDRRLTKAKMIDMLKQHVNVD